MNYYFINHKLIMVYSISSTNSSDSKKQQNMYSVMC